MDTDLYQLLDISSSASEEVVKQALVRMQRLWSKRASNAASRDARQEAERMQDKLSGARRILLDPQARATYDASRRSEPRVPSPTPQPTGPGFVAPSRPQPGPVPPLWPQPAPGYPPAPAPHPGPTGGIPGLRRRTRPTTRVLILGLLALAFAIGGLYDLVTSKAHLVRAHLVGGHLVKAQYVYTHTSALGSFATAALFAILALWQIRRVRAQ